MPNLNLEITDIMYGDIPVLKIMKGDIKKWPLSLYTVTTNFTNITSDAPATTVENSLLTINLTVDSGHYIDDSSVVVIMGGIDISSTYSNGIITIPSVTGNIVITARTMFDAQVEYLEGDGTTYINTGVKIASNVKFNIDLYASNPQNVSAYYLFGGRTGANDGCMYVYKQDTGNYKWYYGTKNGTVTGVSENSINCNNLNAQRHVYINTGHNAVSSQTFSTDADFFLFCMNTGSEPTSTKLSEPLYSAKLYTGSTLVRDYIPVRKDGVGYLFDKVSKILYGNANSTGTFTYGNDV